MSEIIDDGDAVDLCLHFQTALHAFESLQCGRNFFFRDAVIKSQRRRSGGIPYVVFPTQRKLEIGPVLFIVQHGPRSSSLLQLQIGDPPRRIVARTVAFDRTKCPANAAFNTLTEVVCNQASAARHQVYQPLESSFYSVQVLVRSEERRVGKECRSRWWRYS